MTGQDDQAQPIPAEYLIRIGKIVVSWGSLEVVVDVLLRRLGGFALYDQRGAIFTAHMTWPLKMDILETLISELAPIHPWLVGFPKIRTLLKAAQKGRNQIAHGDWIYEGGQVSLLRATARGKLKALPEVISLIELDRIDLAIDRAKREALDFVLNTTKYSRAARPDNPA